MVHVRGDPNAEHTTIEFVSGVQNPPMPAQPTETLPRRIFWSDSVLVSIFTELQESPRSCYVEWCERHPRRGLKHMRQSGVPFSAVGQRRRLQNRRVGVRIRHHSWTCSRSYSVLAETSPESSCFTTAENSRAISASRQCATGQTVPGGQTGATRIRRRFWHWWMFDCFENYSARLQWWTLEPSWRGRPLIPINFACAFQKTFWRMEETCLTVQPRIGIPNWAMWQFVHQWCEHPFGVFGSTNIFFRSPDQEFSRSPRRPRRCMYPQCWDHGAANPESWWLGISWRKPHRPENLCSACAMTHFIYIFDVQSFVMWNLVSSTHTQLFRWNQK